MPHIYTCPEWGALPPHGQLELCPRAARIIFHHTAGHHPEIDTPGSESTSEAFAYARALQHAHFANGWADSGHNWLVTRAGHILQGRWLTASAIEAQHMVISAHCPGQNTQIGIEHEHLGTEAMTPRQREASAYLQAWIAWHYARATPLTVYPHSRYFATACPANLVSEIARIRTRANSILSEWRRGL